MKFVDPKNDVAFQKIFGNENKTEILISFLNAVLGLHGDQEIEEITILNPFQTPKIEALKYTILDVRARDRRGVTFIVEMQVEHLPGYEKRFLYYTSKAYVSQIERAVDYPRLNQVIFIGILDFNAFEGEHYLTRHVILNDKTYQQSIRDLEFNFIELPKFHKQAAELETLLDKWIYFIKHASNLEVIPPNTEESPLLSAYESANKFGWSRDEMELYDYWDMKEQDARGIYEKAVKDALKKGHEEGMQQGHEEGMQQGREEGMQQGREEGMQQGREEGRREALAEIVRSLLAGGLAPEQVSAMTGLSPADVAALRERRSDSTPPDDA